jgi:hypothetical protein
MVLVYSDPTAVGVLALEADANAKENGIIVYVAVTVRSPCLHRARFEQL